jgi:hypothetical protein
MSEWQPISSAPKNGARILLWASNWWHASVGVWYDDKYSRKPRPCWSSESGHLRGRNWERSAPPTHWQPLPPAPPAVTGDVCAEQE